MGTRSEHIVRAKDRFRAMAQANMQKKWVAQAGINFDDMEKGSREEVRRAGGMLKEREITFDIAFVSVMDRRGQA